MTSSLWHDVMGVSADRMSRWDRDHAASAIVSLDAALERAGLPGKLEPPLRLLQRAEELAEQARAAKLAARARLEQANRDLMTEGPIDASAYGAALVECGPWLDDEAA